MNLLDFARESAMLVRRQIVAEPCDHGLLAKVLPSVISVAESYGAVAKLYADLAADIRAAIADRGPMQ